ncbi:cyclic peptide export ABC transporter [Chitinophaga flava]|uniref:Cyclic peptide export ABC transporter n=1 Tax=Chitinophaga flava TaxID=2259036 RepID=A0A365XP89_9BACT|nr:cyclic peptide export ABC transporter [Chitinophaga flava]RBL88152.1 cyclic peptide export ABC transporter [Chitinophaga flava]
MFKITWRNLVFLCVVAIPNTCFTFGILYIINSIVAGRNVLFAAYQAPVFFLLVVLSFGLNVFLQRKIIAFTFHSIYRNEMKIFHCLQRTSLQQLEKIGPERIYSIVEDVRLFVFFPNVITTTISSTLSLFIGIVYYFVLSAYSALIVVALIGLIGLIYKLARKSIFSKVMLLRSLNDVYFKVVDDMIRGFKELKMSSVKSDNLFNDFLGENRAHVRDVETTVGNRYSVMNLFNQYGLYLLIGVILFVLPLFKLLEPTEVISFVVILLFILGPLSNLLNTQNFFVKVRVANKRITAFMEELEVIQLAADNDGIKEPLEIMETLRFEGVSYQHVDEQTEASFVLGPLDFTIRKGETIFVIGGNGSGKSTFINCLTGLYQPSAGNIYLNGKKICNNDARYKDQISAIFTDNHLFSRNYDSYSLSGNKAYEHLLKLMKLDKVVADDDDASARRKFSKGQSKRMAMVFALLDEKPFMVLDEWAADQDPYFRRYFYEEMLPMLKAAGKTIIAVTHDDAYFKHADRILKFDYGTIVKDIRPREKEIEAASLWEL